MENKVNAYIMFYIIFFILILVEIGIDCFLYDKNDYLIFIIHAISIVITYISSVLQTKIYCYFNEGKDAFGECVVVNILNLIPGLNFIILFFSLAGLVYETIRYIKNCKNFTFKL